MNKGLYLKEAHHQHIKSSQVSPKVPFLVQHCFFSLSIFCHPAWNLLPPSLLTTLLFIEKSNRVWMHFYYSPTWIICIVGNRNDSTASIPTSVLSLSLQGSVIQLKLVITLRPSTPDCENYYIYLCVETSDDLSLTLHVNNVTKKAQKGLGYLRRNLANTHVLYVNSKNKVISNVFRLCKEGLLAII